MVLVLRLDLAWCGACEGKNLKYDAQIKIEKTKELPDEECEPNGNGYRTKNGDRIVVHYVGKLRVARRPAKERKNSALRRAVTQTRVVGEGDNATEAACVTATRKPKKRKGSETITSIAI